MTTKENDVCLQVLYMAQLAELQAQVSQGFGDFDMLTHGTFLVDAKHDSTHPSTNR